jgi:hypothetical protein
MKAKNKIPLDPSEQFVKMPRDLLESEAWRGASLTCRRFMDALFSDHLSRGGKHNGNLKATKLQLEEAGLYRIGIAPAIREAEERGLVDRKGGGMRGGVETPSTYTITWLPVRDGAPPSNRWRNYTEPPMTIRKHPAPARKMTVAKMTTVTVAKIATPVNDDGRQNSARETRFDGRQNSDTYLDSTYQGGGQSKKEEDRGSVSGDAACGDDLSWVPQSWVTGDGFVPARCGVVIPAAGRGSPPGKPSDESPPASLPAAVPVAPQRWTLTL